MDVPQNEKKDVVYKLNPGESLVIPKEDKIIVIANKEGEVTVKEEQLGSKKEE